MLRVPPFPSVPDAHVGHADVPVRYEDIDQVGRVKVEALPHAMGHACWRALLSQHGLSRLGREEAVIPILSRLVLDGGDGPVPIARSLHAEGSYRFSHTVDGAGSPNRVLLELYTRVSGLRGRTHGPPPPQAGEPVEVGRLFAEHVFTRPFAKHGERKVIRIPDGYDIDPVPGPAVSWITPESVASLPAGAEPLEDGPRLDDVTLAFGFAHTDSNQHVNSLVYPRLFEEAALRRFAALGRDTKLLVRHIELAYRKPCFAGDRVRVRLAAFEVDGLLGAVGAFEPAGGGRAHCYVRATFSR